MLGDGRLSRAEGRARPGDEAKAEPGNWPGDPHAAKELSNYRFDLL
jgi:hypothetical protein